MAEVNVTPARLACWANRWGDLDRHEHRPLEWKEGYEQAMSDVGELLRQMAPGWVNIWSAERWGYRDHPTFKEPRKAGSHASGAAEA